MKTFQPLLAAAALSLLPLATAHAKIERTVEQSFAVQPGGTLHVATQGGEIRVETGNGDTVRVVARERIRASSDTEADAILKGLALTIEQKGSDVSAVAKYEGESSNFHVGSWPPVQVDFIVSVPSRYSAELKTSGGDIRVGDLQGTVNAHTSGGNVKLGHITGAVDAATSGGNMKLVQGDAEVRLATSGGNIALGRIGGPTDVRTSGGDIKAEAVDNTLTARTSGGDISVVFTSALKGDCLLSTSGGRVEAFVPPGVKFHVEASTSGGVVRSNGVAVEGGKSGRHSLVGSVNGGGPRLRLRSSGGDVSIGTKAVGPAHAASARESLPFSRGKLG